MILNIVIVILFIIIFIVVAYIAAYYTHKTPQQRPYNGYFHINENTPLIYNSNVGVLSGYENTLEESDSPHDGIPKAEIDESLPLVQMTHKSDDTETDDTTCLNDIESEYQDGKNGVWNQMECGQWWKDNIPSVIGTFVGILLAVKGYLDGLNGKGVEYDLNAKQWIRMNQKLNKQKFIDPDTGKSVSVKKLRNMDTDKLNKILNHEPNLDNAAKFVKLFQNDPDFASLDLDVEKSFKVTMIPTDAMDSISDFSKKIPPDFKKSLQNLMPGVDLDSIPVGKKMPLVVRVNELSVPDLNKNAVRTKNLPGLSSEQNDLANLNRKQKLDDLNKIFNGVNTVDDVDFLSKLDKSMLNTDKNKIFASFGIDQNKTIPEINSKFQSILDDFKKNNIYPSTTKFNFDDLKPKATSDRANFEEFKKMHDDFYEGDKTKVFMGSKSLNDTMNHPKFTLDDFSKLKKLGIIDPNTTCEIDKTTNKKIFKQLVPQAHGIISVEKLPSIDHEISESKLQVIEYENKSDKMSKLNEVKKIHGDDFLNKFKNTGFDGIDAKSFKLLKELDLLPENYIMDNNNKVVQVETQDSPKVKTRSFDVKGTAKGAAMGAAVGAPLAIMMGLKKKKKWDEDMTKDVSAVVIGAVVSNIIEEALEYAAEKAFQKSSLKLAQRSLAKQMGKDAAKKASMDAAKTGADKATQKAAAKAAYKKGAKEGAKAAVKEAAEQAAKKAAAKAAKMAAKNAAKSAAKTGIKAAVKGALKGVMKAALAGQVGAVLMVIDIVGLVVDMVDPCGFESEIKKKKMWDMEFKRYEEKQKVLMTHMGKSYPGLQKPDLIRKNKEFDPLTGSITTKIVREDEMEYNRYYDSYFEKCHLIKNAECKDNSYAAAAMNAIRQGRINLANNLMTNMVNPYAVQPVYIDNIMVGDDKLLGKVSVRSDMKVAEASMETIKKMLSGEIVAKTKNLEIENIELKSYSKLISEDFNSKTMMHYVVIFFFFVIMILLVIKIITIE